MQMSRAAIGASHGRRVAERARHPPAAQARRGARDLRRAAAAASARHLRKHLASLPKPFDLESLEEMVGMLRDRGGPAGGSLTGHRFFRGLRGVYG
jgi:predicted deacetylase